jgi:putative Mg2+ transporter-C (MgtC) family protein
MDLSYIDVGLRLGAAALSGGMIGINRDLADRPIGTRTLGLVALGAAAVAVATIQVSGMAENKDAMSPWCRASSRASWLASASSARA